MKKKYHSLLVISASLFFAALLILQLLWLRQVLRSESDNLNSTLLSALNEASVCMNWYEEEVLNYDSIMLTTLTSHINRLNYKDKIYFTKRIKKHLNDSFLLTRIPQYHKVITLSYLKDNHSVDTNSTSLVFNELKKLRYKVITKYINRSVKRALAKRNISIDYYLNLEKSGDTLYHSQSTFLDTSSLLKSLLFPHHTYTYRHFLFDTEEDPSEWLLNITYFNVMGYLIGKSSGSFLLASLFIILLSFNFILLLKYLHRLKANYNNEQKIIEGITHDIKTPLSTIQLATNKIASLQAGEHPIGYYTDIIMEQQGRINSQINLLLDHVKYNEYHLDLNKTLTDPELLVNQAIQMLHSLSNQKQAKVILLNQSEKKEVQMDRELSLLVIKTLIENALKHNPNEVLVEIEIGYSMTHLIISIRDNGVGIPEKEIPNIFKRYYSSRKKVSEAENISHGIGLFFVKWIMELHKGEISLESIVGQGTRITLCYPI